jgi:putative membrane protein
MKMDERTILAIIAIGAFAIFAIGGWGMGSPMMGLGMMTGWGGMGLGMGLFLVLVIVGLFLLFTGSRYEPRYEGRAQNIARERYAKGEITKEEYDEIVKNL